jgi:twitching motility two-component system response regulator PilG
MYMGKVFKVGVFGLTSNEKNTLGSIFKLASSRSRQYTMVGNEEADIVLVDFEEGSSKSQWRSFSVHRKLPAIKVSKKPPAEKSANEYYLRRPLILKRVLEALDEVTIKELRYLPELEVGGEGMLDDEASAAIQKANMGGSGGLSGIKALVVDDALPVRKAMEIQLRLYSMDMDFAETGEEAVELIQNNVYNIIFLDVMLPGIDGFEVCRKIKANKTSKNTPVVMLTGKDGKMAQIKGKMAGSDEYLTKPVDQEQLKEVIKQYLPNAAA